ncbi:MAG: FAD-dependent oxidoreductase [Deltaproteobacteria bacterium]|nr:FAD-dependent oxidoreductase [Deltaproteobacteria bacterium]
MSSSDQEKRVVVAGSGAAGLAAAVTLAEAGFQVTVFEKRSTPGGSTNFVEGVYGVESEQQLRRNIEETRDDGFRELMEYSHWRANASLVRAIVNRSGESISWLEERGVPFIGPRADFLGGPPVWHLIEGFGVEMVKALVARVLEKGGEIRFDSALKEVVRDPSGAISGAIVEDKQGRRMREEAGAVIVATGGYANNGEWIKKYAGLESGKDAFPVLTFDKDGDGIAAAWNAGAGQEGLGVLIYSVGSPPRAIKPRDHLLGVTAQPTLWVNRAGVRFCDEAIVQNMIHTGNALARQPGGFCFRIFDDGLKEEWAEKGGFNLGNYAPPRTPLTKVDAELRALLEAGNPFVFAADTIEELADRMGVERGALAKTVADYNRFCEQGYDEQFAKDRRYLRALKTPKYYGLKCYPDFICTCGGIKINHRIEVLEESGEVIPGLYAAGSDTGGMFGDSYDVAASGIASGFAVTSGRIAGENAAAYVEGRIRR